MKILMKKNFKILSLFLSVFFYVALGAYSQDYSQIRFDSPSDSVAYMRLQELRRMPIDEMTADELEEYREYKNSDLSEKYKPVNMFKSGSASLCSNAIAFCTDEGVYSYAAGTDDAQAIDFSSGGTGISCLYTTPSPAWFYMRAASDGDLLIYMEHSGGYDIDFVCWGPFTAPNSQALLSNCVSGFQTSPDHGNHRPSGGNHQNNMGGYPDGNVIDCSYSVEATEWCYIPDVHVGEWYVFLITNYSTQAGTISFQSQWQSWMVSPPVPHTDCNIIAELSPSTPICEGTTLSIACSEVTGALSYKWYYLGSASNETVGTGTQISTSRNLSRTNATTAMSGWYAVDIQMPSRTSRFLTYVNVMPKPTTPSVSASPSAICNGQQNSTITVTNANGSYSYSWNTGTSGTSIVVSPEATRSYYVTASITTTSANPNTNVSETKTCTSSSSAQVTVNDVPSVSISPSESNICNGNSVTLSSNVISCNGCQYNWSNNTHGSDATVSPTAPTTYTLTVSSSNGCTATANAIVNVMEVGSVSECNVIYVSVAGGGDGLSPYDPTDIFTALNNANCSGALICMEEGTYNIDVPLELGSNITLEGGYFNDFKQKTSEAGATTIYRTSTYVNGTATAPRIVAIEVPSGASNFSLHDLTVKTANAPQNFWNESSGGSGESSDELCYSENFDSYTASNYNTAGGGVPTGWDVIFTGSSSAYSPHVCPDGGLYNNYTITGSGTNGFCFTSGSDTYGANNYAILPARCSNASRISFKYRFESASYGTLTVGYITNASDASTYNVLETVPSNTTPGTTASYDIAGRVPSGARLAFRWTYTSSYYTCGIDDVSVYVAPSSTCEDFDGTAATAYNVAGNMPSGWFSYTTATGNYIVAPHVCSGSSYNYYNSGSQSLNLES